MAPRRKYNPSISNALNVKISLASTVKTNEVAKKDLEFWLPLTIPHLNKAVPGVQTLDELIAVPKSHARHILSVLIKLYRERREPNGKRYTNASLIVKVETQQRVIRLKLQEEYDRLVLVDPNTPVRTFNFFEDPELKVMYNTLNEEMKISAGLGLTTGMKKRERTNLEPDHLRQIMMLWDLKKPKDVEHVFAITIMMHIGARGGVELREMTCQQFEYHSKEGVGNFQTFPPMKQGKLHI